MRCSRLALLVAIALLLSAIAPSPAAVHAQGGAYVLVRRDAYLYAHADERSERVRDPWRRQYAVRIGPFWVMRFVREQGQWVEVATVPGFRATDHCYDTIGALEGLDLHLFVKRDAIAPVLGRTIRRTFEDGSRLTLTGGVGLVRRGAQYDAHVRGATLRLRMEDGEIADRYTAARRIAVSRSSNALLTGGAEIAIGDQLRLASEAGGGRARRSSHITFGVREARSDAPPSRGEPPRAVLAVEAPPEDGPRAQVTVRNDCLEAVGWVRRNQLTLERPTRAVNELRTRLGTSLRTGAALFWPDGTPAGRAAHEAGLEGSMEPQDGRMCFQHPLRPPSRRPSADDTLTLCVARSSIVQTGRSGGL